MIPKRPAPFRLSNKAQSGLLLLAVLVLLLFIAWQVFRQLPPRPDDSRNREFQAAWMAFKNAQLEHAEKAKGDPLPLRLREFDPNRANKQTLLGLGLTERTVGILLNYRKHGGHFRSKEDLKKVYTLTDADYQRLAPYIRIRKKAKPASLEAETPAVLELNTASVQHLARLPGMNFQLAKRLLEFRDYLGGFHTVRQIRELHGFPDSSFREVKSRLRVSKAHLRKIDLNTASSDELEDHPYITRKMAEAIYGLKRRLGQLDSVAQIKQLSLINAEKYRKIAPYLETH